MTFIPNRNEVDILLVGGGGVGGPMWSHANIGDLPTYYSGGGGGGQVLHVRVTPRKNQAFVAQVGGGGKTPLDDWNQPIVASALTGKGETTTVNLFGGPMFQALGGGRGGGWDLFENQQLTEAFSKIENMTGACGGGGFLNIRGGKGTAGGNGADAVGFGLGGTQAGGGGGGAGGPGLIATTGQANGGIGARSFIINLAEYFAATLENGLYGAGGAGGFPGSYGGARGGADAQLSRLGELAGGYAPEPGFSAEPNRGGGGGGIYPQGWDYLDEARWLRGGDGGTGLVIVAYAGPPKVKNLQGEWITQTFPGSGAITHTVHTLYWLQDAGANEPVRNTGIMQWAGMWD